MPGKGIDFILPSDYEKLVVARQTELFYIEKQLLRTLDTDSNKVTLELLQWIRDRCACLAVADAQVQR